MLHSIIAVALVAQITTASEPPALLDEPTTTARDRAEENDDTVGWSMLIGGGGAIAGLAVGVAIATVAAGVPGAFLAPVIFAAIGASLAGVPSSSQWVAGVAAASAVGGMLVGGAALGATGFAIGWVWLANQPPPPPDAIDDMRPLVIIALAGIGAAAGAIVGTPVGGAIGAGVMDSIEE